MAYEISEFVCPQNHRCPLIKVCPVGAISQDGQRLPVIDQKKCNECGLCKISCPLKAVTFKK
jgi:Fe-S-cluster-containing hydrogenase component 2